MLLYPVKLCIKRPAVICWQCNGNSHYVVMSALLIIRTWIKQYWCIFCWQFFVQTDVDDTKQLLKRLLQLLF